MNNSIENGGSAGRKLVVSNAEVKEIVYFWAATIMSRIIDMNGNKLSNKQLGRSLLPFILLTLVYEYFRIVTV